MNSTDKILVLGATGKTGRRIVQRLAARNIPVRLGSRAAEIPFDWEDDTIKGTLVTRDGKVVNPMLTGEGS